MDLKRSKELADRLLAKVSVIGRVTVKNEALNASEPVKTQAVRVRLINRKADSGDDAATIEALVGATAFPIEGGELMAGGSTYDIVSVTQSGVGIEHIIQRVVLRER